MVFIIAWNILTIPQLSQKWDDCFHFVSENIPFHKVVYCSMMDNISAISDLGYNTVPDKEEAINISFESVWGVWIK